MGGNGGVKVYVINPGRSRYYVLRWKDPANPKAWRERTTQTTRKREAYREAAQLEKLLSSGSTEPGEMLWDDFRDIYQAEKVSTLAVKTAKIWKTAANHYTRIIKPVLLAEATAQALSRFASRLRVSGISETSISTYLRHLQAAFNWAEKMGYLETAPAVEYAKRKQRSTRGEMRGRPITFEEFERILDKTPCPTWRYLLRGIWHSGLRLGEALDLHWSDQRRISVEDLDTRLPMFRIPAGGDKSQRAKLTPMAPEFVELLRAVPIANREGYVFRPLIRSGRFCRSMETASRKISRIGEAAGVVVSRDGATRYATAHDLRRSFGARWAVRVMPAVLQKMMRHESIETTMRYYVGQNAELSAQAMWQAFYGESCGDGGEASQGAETPGDINTGNKRT